MKELDHQQRIARVFNLAAPDYDHPALRFFPECAGRLAGLANLAAGASVLDVGTGTGAIALAAARAVGETGRVVGIDLAPEMLARARKNVEAAGLATIDLREMDATRLEFPENSFEAALCAFGIFLMPDEVEALAEWRRVLKPGGLVGFSVFGDDAFQPLSEMFVERIQEFGVTFPAGRRAFATQKITQPEQCGELLDAAGFSKVEIHTEQHGYFLPGPAEWWSLMWGSGFRGAIARIPADKVEAFRAAHLEDVAKRVTVDGLWIDVPAIFAFGQK